MRRSLSVIAALLISACGLLPDKIDETKNWSASRFYSEAKEELEDGNYPRAVQLFETLESRYPYGRYAQQSQLEIAYAYYKDDDSASAIAAADRFIKLHPNHPNVDYAYYLKGLTSFNEEAGFFAAVGGQDLTERDPKAARESFDAFKELTTRYPQSRYAADATARMLYLTNALATHEVHVARYYVKRGAHIAAINRAQYVLTTYPQAPARLEALQIMVKSYDVMGMANLRDDTARVLRQNFPDSGKGDKSWWKFW